MGIINHLHVHILNSSTAAYKLAIENPKYTNTAKRIIGIKNVEMEYAFATTNSNSKKAKLEKKCLKYKKYLESLNNLRHPQDNTAQYIGNKNSSTTLSSEKNTLIDIPKDQENYHRNSITSWGSDFSDEGSLDYSTVANKDEPIYSDILDPLSTSLTSEDSDNPFEPTYAHLHIYSNIHESLNIALINKLNNNNDDGSYYYSITNEYPHSLSHTKVSAESEYSLSHITSAPNGSKIENLQRKLGFV